MNVTEVFAYAYQMKQSFTFMDLSKTEKKSRKY